LPCQHCKCKSFAFIPSRPEDVGEFWFQRRRNFNVSEYRVKCRCKHAHDVHDPIMRKCKEKGKFGGVSYFFFIYLLLKNVVVECFNLIFYVLLVINIGKSMILFLRQKRKEEVKSCLLVSIYGNKF
jgi:hypothetical protein